MSTIRRQSILSSVIIYLGFAVGFLNTLLYTREGGFTQEEYGLTGTFIAIATVMFSFANLGTQAFIYKFFPYYKDNLKPRENDMMTWALLTGLIGFALVGAAGIVFKSLVIRKYGAHSALLVQYYYWVFPFGFGLTIFSILESYGWQLRRSVLTTFLREMAWRVYVTFFIVLTTIGVIGSFDGFIKWFSLSYLFLALVLLVYLRASGQLFFPTRASRVTRKYSRKILTLSGFFWSGNVVFQISRVFDILVIGAVVPGGLAYVGVFTLAQNVSSLIQAPQRGIIAASINPLSAAWKRKDIEKIRTVYHRSAINQLLFACGMFVLIWINFTDGVLTFHLQRNYLQAQYVFLFLGLMQVADLGTGVNTQIISTSSFWRFEFFTGLILLAISIPLNYILAKKMGVVGPAIATLLATLVYNSIRYLFLLRKFGLQPFDRNTLYTLLLAAAGYGICHLLFYGHRGFGWIAARSLTFLAVYLTGVLALRLSPDMIPVWRTFRGKFIRRD